jgi:uncharacterized repeat protein (TIGR01451 family)
VDLQFSATASMATPAENENYVYTLTVTNIGTQDATNVIANATFPFNHAEYTTHVVSQGAIVVPIGVWTIGTIPAGGMATLTINATARPGEAAAGSFDLPFALTSLTEPDSNGANNTSVATVDIGYYVSFIYVNDGSQTIANDGLCTLTEAINNANGNNFSNTQPLLIGECPTGKIAVDSIQLSTNVTTTNAVTYVAVGTNALPPVTSDILINGCCGHSITLAGGGARLFYVGFGSSLTLQNVTVTGGAPPVGDSGGAIFNEGSLNIIDGTQLTNNVANTTIGGGGAIYNNGGTVVVINGSVISNNDVINASPLSGGGGIKMSGGSLTIDNSNVSFNDTPLGMGGGISCTSCNIVMSGGASISNNTSGDGGGMYYSGTGTLNITSAVFANNSANGTGNRRGGAILFDATGISTITASFSGNIADNGFGGAFYVQSGHTVNFTNSTFTGNQTVGGASQGGVAFNNGVVNFNNVTFTGNLDAGTTATIIINNGGTADFGNNTLISIGHASPQCGGGGFSNDGSNTGGDGSCF